VGAAEMEQLEYLEKQIREMITLAKSTGDGMLVYLLEMTLAETHDEINKRRQQLRSS
jgi:hypothetical protein